MLVTSLAKKILFTKDIKLPKEKSHRLVVLLRYCSHLIKHCLLSL